MYVSPIITNFVADLTLSKNRKYSQEEIGNSIDHIPVVLENFMGYSQDHLLESFQWKGNTAALQLLTSYF